MLQYWKSENDGYCTYSIDMVRFDFTVSDENLNFLIKYLENGARCDVESYGLSTSPFKFRHLFKINYTTGSMAVGLGFNGITKEDGYKCFCEFNPNKVFQDKKSWGDLFVLIDYSRRFKLKRYDLAIDIPVGRNLIQLVKDHRKYSLTMLSSVDKTEYLGCRNKGGFVKLYNKTIESKLKYDLTRLEITCDGDMNIDDIMNSIPRLLFSPLQEKLVLDKGLSDKDRLLVDLLKMHPDMFSRLDRRNKVKFQPYIFASEADIEFDRFLIQKCVKHLSAFVK